MVEIRVKHNFTTESGFDNYHIRFTTERSSVDLRGGQDRDEVESFTLGPMVAKEHYVRA